MRSEAASGVADSDDAVARKSYSLLAPFVGALGSQVVSRTLHRQTTDAWHSKHVGSRGSGSRGSPPSVASKPGTMGNTGAAGGSNAFVIGTKLIDPNATFRYCRSIQTTYF